MTEIEIKLQIPAHQQQALLQHLHTLTVEQIPLQAKYYETPEAHLARHHAAIRVRREGTKWIQMLKAKGQSDLHRLEYEIDLGERTHADLDLSLFQSLPAAQQFLENALGAAQQHLALQFETDVQRTQCLVPFGNSEIEISLDVGEIRSRAATTPLHEIEFELKSGNLLDLIELCKHWTQQFSLWIDVRSKAERGHLMAADQAVRAAKHFKLPSEPTFVRVLNAFHQAFLPNMAAIIANVADHSHTTALFDALQQLNNYMTHDLKAAERLALPQVQTWQPLMQQLSQCSEATFAQHLAASTTQHMLLEQLQYVYQPH